MAMKDEEVKLKQVVKWKARTKKGVGEVVGVDKDAKRGMWFAVSSDQHRAGHVWLRASQMTLVPPK